VVSGRAAANEEIDPLSVMGDDRRCGTLLSCASHGEQTGDTEGTTDEAGRITQRHQLV